MKSLQARAKLYHHIRDFFNQREVLEVETPLLSQHTVTDLHIESFATHYRNGHQQHTYYLQTSPEYAMKRLLATGCGSIFQICKAFRNGEYGQQHNPEFTLLEWYRLDFNHHQLMQEVDELLQLTLASKPAEKMTYQKVWLDHLNIDPLTCNTMDLQHLIQQKHLMSDQESRTLDKDTSLQLLFSHCIEPQLGFATPLFIYDFPASQAALARLSNQDPRVAERFELFIAGTEIANGFHELLDAQEQKNRFLQDQTLRKQKRFVIPKIDERFLHSLASLPSCAGVALGIDRLLMLINKTTSIKETLTFDWNQA